MNSERKIKHYSMVQNKSIYYKDLKAYEGKVMLSMEIPRYFPFDNTYTPIEIQFQKRMKDSVIFVQLRD